MSLPAALQPKAKRALWIAGWAVLAAALAFAAYALPWREIAGALAAANWLWVLAAVVIITVEWPAWVLQWWLLAPPAHRPSFARMAQVTALSQTANTSVPMAGAVAAVGFLIVRGRMSPGAATSLYAVDQLVTGFAKVGILALAGALAPVPDWFRTALISLSVAMAVFTVALIAAAHGGDAVRRLGTRFGAERLAGIVAGVIDHLEPMRRPSVGLTATALAFVKKAIEVMGALAVQVAVGMEPSLTGAIVVTAAIGLATMAPISPGHIGVYEATVIFAYQYLGVPLPLAAAAALIQHAATFAASLACIAYLAWALPRDRVTAA